MRKAALVLVAVVGPGAAAAGSGVGVYGAGSGVGVYGAGSGVGVYGAGSGVGVYGAGSGVGVYGAGSGVGVYGAGSGVGVYGGEELVVQQFGGREFLVLRSGPGIAFAPLDGEELDLDEHAEIAEELAELP